MMFGRNEMQLAGLDMVRHVQVGAQFFTEFLEMLHCGLVVVLCPKDLVVSINNRRFSSHSEVQRGYCFVRQGYSLRLEAEIRKLDPHGCILFRTENKSSDLQYALPHFNIGLASIESEKT